MDIANASLLDEATAAIRTKEKDER